MNVLVTGATGFTGGHLARYLVARGDQVRALVRGLLRDEAQVDDVVQETLTRALESGAGCRAVQDG